MTTLAERAKAAGLESAAELTRITGTSKETLTNWMKDKPVLFEIVLTGAAASKQPPQQEAPPAKEEKAPEQTWCFSHEDLQLQAKTIEVLQENNLLLKAMLELKEREIAQLSRDLKKERKDGIVLSKKITALEEKLRMQEMIENGLRQQHHKAWEVIKEHNLMGEV